MLFSLAALVWAATSLQVKAQLYAVVCNNQPTTLYCPGDTFIQIGTVSVTRLANGNQAACGTNTRTTGALDLSCMIPLTAPNGTVQYNRVLNDCAFRKQCTTSFSAPVTSYACANGTQTQRDTLVIKYYCGLTGKSNEAIVCDSAAATNGYSSQVISCPAGEIIAIDAIVADRTPDGSSCLDIISASTDFSSNLACSSYLETTHDFYKNITASCQALSTCTVRGTSISLLPVGNCNDKNAPKNWQQIYYSCHADLSLKATFCANGKQASSSSLSCGGNTAIQISEIKANRLYFGDADQCTYADAVQNFGVPGCEIDVGPTDPVYTQVAAPCNGRQTCSVNLLPYVGTPCGSSGLTLAARNWFSLSYSCTPTAVSTQSVCVNQSLSMQCSIGTQIMVKELYATRLYFSGSDTYDFSCPAALSVHNSEVGSCKLNLYGLGESGSSVYTTVTQACNGRSQCSVLLGQTVTGPNCGYFSAPLEQQKEYSERNVFTARFDCVQGSVGSVATGTGSNVDPVGLGLGLTALFVVIIVVVVVAVYKRRSIRNHFKEKTGAISTDAQSYNNF